MHLWLRKYLWFIFGWIAFHAAAQNRDNIWQLGLAPKSYAINFNSGYADTFSLIRKMNFFETDASICNPQGELLFYTNGVWIANRNHDSLFNTQNFNAGYATDFYGDDGLGFTQAAIAIPEPDQPSKYLLFYHTCDTVHAYGIYRTQPLYLSCSEIDMNLDEGLGGITTNKKNIHVVQDTIIQGRVTACKHANGRDWWVVVHKFHSDCYYKLLIEPDTILGPFEQCVGNKFIWDDEFGMAVFSPDGSEYAHLNENDTIDLLDFDRCTGEFSNPRTLIVPDSGALSGMLGCSFSPNSRFLYANSYLELWQFDTQEEDPNQSRLLIDTISINSIFQWMSTNQLAPDGKIYVSTFNGNDKLSVINEPDSIGKNCNFNVTSFDLPPPYGNLCVPNFPNYDLGPLDGSGCDTIVTGISNQVSAMSSFRVYPNPANSYFNITYQTDANATLEITDLFGREVMHSTLYPYFKSRIFYTDELSDGMYLVTIKSKEGNASKKLVIAK